MNLLKNLKLYENLSKKLKKFDEKKERIKEEKRQEFWEEENKKYDKKLSWAEEIFGWTKNFLQSKEYTKLKNLIYSNNEVDIYFDTWGHVRNKEGREYWSKLYLQENNTVVYKAGYKWMGIMENMKFNKPEELAEKLTTQYIRGLYKQVKDEKVLERFEEEVKEKTKKLRDRTKE